MPKGYWIVRMDVHDPEHYKKYVAANAKPLAAYGAKFLVRGGLYQNPEGTSRQRSVVVEFPSYQAAVDCYHSAAYQATIDIRRPVSEGDFVLVEGYDGPQPT